jgi:hypothetical protein
MQTEIVDVDAAQTPQLDIKSTNDTGSEHQGELLESVNVTTKAMPNLTEKQPLLQDKRLLSNVPTVVDNEDMNYLKILCTHFGVCEPSRYVGNN